jgi:hypothetical protein
LWRGEESEHQQQHACHHSPKDPPSLPAHLPAAAVGAVLAGTIEDFMTMGANASHGDLLIFCFVSTATMYEITDAISSIARDGF